MTAWRAFITDVGVLSPAGGGLGAVRRALLSASQHLSRNSLFPLAPAHDHLVGQVSESLPSDGTLPRTHRLALAALDQLSTRRLSAVDWICLGTTTGGIGETESLLERDVRTSPPYRHHGLGTVVQVVESQLHRRVPTITLSTACSSGAVALLAGLELIRQGRARCVLAGGVESLCRLTCSGFSLLQIVDPTGAHPLDAERKGMTVAEGAALFVLEAAEEPPPGVLAELRGGGLSCDAYHPTAPEPAGRGAMRAMQRALNAAGVAPADVDYINLHGTGTPDNDAAEARAVRTVFGDCAPRLSSTKGALGHSLAASGAVEAAVAITCLREGLVPANVGLRRLDKGLGLNPCELPRRQVVSTVLSNSLGFGGNNAAIVLAQPDQAPPAAERERASWGRLSVLSAACLTGAGDTESTSNQFFNGRSCAGRFADESLASRFTGRAYRRWRRLPRLACWVVDDAIGMVDEEHRAVDGVFWATGWGALTETDRFLKKLRDSDGVFSSPIDFASSVHNAPAGLIAMRLGARGPNVTTSASTGSFWQAMLATSLFADGGIQLLAAADEHHETFTPLLQPTTSAVEADGAAALVVTTESLPGPYVEHVTLPAISGDLDDALERLLEMLGGPARMVADFGALWLGDPLVEQEVANRQRRQIEAHFGDALPVVRYTEPLGRFPTVAGVAAVLALRAARDPMQSGPILRDAPVGRPQLLMELGEQLTAIKVGWQ